MMNEMPFCSAFITHHSSLLTLLSISPAHFSSLARRQFAFDLVAILQLVQRGHGSLHQVLRGLVERTLGEDVSDAGELRRRVGTLLAGGSRPCPDAAGARMTVLAPLVPLTGVRDRRALEFTFTRLLTARPWSPSRRPSDFVGLAVNDADVALAIARDDERAEAEGSAALDDLGAAIDANDSRLHAGLVAIAIASAARAATTTTAALSASTPPPRPPP
jgi:hypothetical protein